MESESAVKRQTKLDFGIEQTPRYAVNGSLTVTIETGSCIYCIKPMTSDVVITSVKDLNGDAVAALAGITVSKSDEFKINLSEIVFTAIAAGNCVVCYVRNASLG